MNIYRFDHDALSMLSCKDGVYYLDDGSINTEEVRYQVSSLMADHKTTRKMDSYQIAWSLYFFCTLDISNKDHLQLMHQIWNLFNTCAKNDWYSVLNEMSKTGVDVMKNSKSFLALLGAQEPSKKKDLRFDLLLFGLSLYAVAHPKADAPMHDFIAKLDFSDPNTNTRLAKQVHSYPDFPFVAMADRAYADGFKELGACLIKTYFRRLFVKFVKSSYSVESAMKNAWPCMHRNGVSMVETLSEIRSTSKGANFYNDIFAWYNTTENDSSALTIAARQQLLLLAENMIEERIGSASPWTSKDFCWMKLCIDMPTDHPKYDATRIRIAETLNAMPEHYMVSWYTYALKSGRETLDAFLEMQKNKKTQNAFMSLLRSHPSDELKWVLSHPLFLEHLNSEQLFNHYYTQSKNTNKNKLFENWTMLRTCDPQHLKDTLARAFYWSNQAILDDIARVHKNLFPTNTLVDDLSKEVRLELISLLGLEIYVLVSGYERYFSLYPEDEAPTNRMLCSDSNFGFPKAVSSLALLDGSFMRKKREDVRALIHARTPAKAVFDIYKSWIAEWFGSIVLNEDFVSTFVRDEQTFMDYFKAQYLANHPEMGDIMEEIELGDFF